MPASLSFSHHPPNTRILPPPPTAGGVLHAGEETAPFGASGGLKAPSLTQETREKGRLGGETFLGSAAGRQRDATALGTEFVF